MQQMNGQQVMTDYLIVDIRSDIVHDTALRGVGFLTRIICSKKMYIDTVTNMFIVSWLECKQ